MKYDYHWSDKPTCWLCDHWWVVLIILVLALTAYFTSSYWLPYIQ